jgi:hypothetical protein
MGKRSLRHLCKLVDTILNMGYLLALASILVVASRIRGVVVSTLPS